MMVPQNKNVEDSEHYYYNTEDDRNAVISQA